MTSSTTSDGASEPVYCVQMHRMGKNMRPRKKKLNDMCCNKKPTRMAVQNRVTLTMNIGAPKRNVAQLTKKTKQTRTNTDVVHEPTHQVLLLASPKRPLHNSLYPHPRRTTVQQDSPHRTPLAIPTRNGFVKYYVRSDNMFPSSCCGQNQQP